jgi:hypothetical protein
MESEYTQELFNDISVLSMQFLATNEMRPKITGFIRKAAMTKYAESEPAERARSIELYVSALDHTLHSMSDPELSSRVTDIQKAMH